MSRIKTGERLMALVASALCLVLITFANQAQAKEQNVLTLQQALKRTLQYNPRLDVFEFKQQSLNGEQKTASLLPAYQVGAELENFAGNGEFQGIKNSELTVSLSSAIELGGKLDARLGVVKSKRTYLETQKALESLQLMADTTYRYLELLTAQERILLAEEAYQLAEQTLVVVQKRASAGAANKAEVKRAKAALAQAKLTLQTEHNQKQLLLSSLSMMWGNQEPDFSSVSGDLYQFGQDLSFKTLNQKLQNNPAIRQFAAQERLRQSELDLAKANSNNDFNWSVGITRNQASSDIGFRAGFNMALFTESRSQGTLQSLRAAKEEAYVSKQVALLRIRNQLLKAYRYRQQSIAAVGTLQNTIIPALEQALKETKVAYQRGRYSYLEYVSARQELIAAKRQLIDTASAALTYGVTIEQLSAEPLNLVDNQKTALDEQTLNKKALDKGASYDSF